MKLLFDENLPPSLVMHLATEFPLSRSVAATELAALPDSEIVTYAKENGFTIVSKDVHFYRHCVAHGHPPKVIWMRTGNVGMSTLISALRRAKERIDEFAMNDEPYLILK